jgi:hypothetical protein
LLSAMASAMLPSAVGTALIGTVRSILGEMRLGGCANRQPSGAGATLADGAAARAPAPSGRRAISTTSAPASISNSPAKISTTTRMRVSTCRCTLTRDPCFGRGSSGSSAM